MNRTTMLAAGLATLLLAGCSSASEPASTSSSATTSSTVTCTAAPRNDDVSRAVLKAQLAGGLKITQVQRLDNDVVVRVCGAGTAGDELKRQANKIGAALKASPASKPIDSLRVTNLSASGDGNRVRCEDFQLNTFAGADGTELATWKLPSEES